MQIQIVWPWKIFSKEWMNLKIHGQRRQKRDIGNKIAYYRRKRGISQENLGEMIKQDTKCIQAIEEFDGFSNDKSPWYDQSLMILLEIVDALQLKVVAFFLPVNDEIFEQY